MSISESIVSQTNESLNYHLKANNAKTRTAKAYYRKKERRVGDNTLLNVLGIISTSEKDYLTIQEIDIILSHNFPKQRPVDKGRVNKYVKRIERGELIQTVIHVCLIDDSDEWYLVDGQHRLEAFKQWVRKEYSRNTKELEVTVVTHQVASIEDAGIVFSYFDEQDASRSQRDVNKAANVSEDTEIFPQYIDPFFKGIYQYENGFLGIKKYERGDVNNKLTFLLKYKGFCRFLQDDVLSRVKESVRIDQLKSLFTNAAPLTFLTFLYASDPEKFKKFIDDMCEHCADDWICETYENGNPFSAIYSLLRNTRGFSLVHWGYAISITWNGWLNYQNENAFNKMGKRSVKKNMTGNQVIDDSKSGKITLEGIKFNQTPAARGIGHYRKTNGM